MSNRMFQSVISQIKEVIGREIGIIDIDLAVVANTDSLKIGTVVDNQIFEDGSSDELIIIEGNTYKAFETDSKYEHAVYVEGDDEIARTTVELACIALSNIKLYYDEKFDRKNFIKNVILDNVLPGDIFIKARELHLNPEVYRVVLLIKVLNQSDINVFDIIQNLFPDKQKDFIFNINESEVVLVKEVKSTITTKDVEKLARSIVDTLNSEFYTRCVIGIGTSVIGIKDLARSFKEAQVALEVGKVFDTEKSIICYEGLGIARLIYQLPTTLCDTFLREVFKRGSIESLDHETLFTIQKFFENNLNVSETSRKLFVHRNTLVYRLEKIRKITGLDLREFDHAIVFKIALMVKNYLNSNPIKF